MEEIRLKRWVSSFSFIFEGTENIFECSEKKIRENYTRYYERGIGAYSDAF